MIQECTQCSNKKLDRFFNAGSTVCLLCEYLNYERTGAEAPAPPAVAVRAPRKARVAPKIGQPADYAISDFRYTAYCTGGCERWIKPTEEPYLAAKCSQCWTDEERPKFEKTWGEMQKARADYLLGLKKR